MQKEKPILSNLTTIDETRLDQIVDQIPRSFAILENIRAKIGFSLKGATTSIEIEPSKKNSTIKKIKRLETYLCANDLINRKRPSRMPQGLERNTHYWWIKEKFLARKVIIPTPILLDRYGIIALTVWVSEPRRAPKPKHEFDFTGSFLYLPTAHFEAGRTSLVISGCSALQFIVNAANDEPLCKCDWKEPFGRHNLLHPIEKLSSIGAFTSDLRQLESLYYVRYMTDEQSYLRRGKETRTNDIIGYPIYIAELPPSRNKNTSIRK